MKLVSIAWQDVFKSAIFGSPDLFLREIRPTCRHPLPSDQHGFDYFEREKDDPPFLQAFETIEIEEQALFLIKAGHDPRYILSTMILSEVKVSSLQFIAVHFSDAKHWLEKHLNVGTPESYIPCDLIEAENSTRLTKLHDEYRHVLQDMGDQFSVTLHH